MKIIASREFQSNYQRLDDPVVVMARSRKLGTWYPKGTEPVSGDDEQTDTTCPICRRVIVNEAHGGPHPSPSDHDTGPHVAAAYGKLAKSRKAEP